MSDAYTPQQHGEFTNGAQLTEVPNATILAEQGKAAGITRAYGIGANGANQENRSAVRDNRDNVRLNPLDTYENKGELGRVDRQAIETHVNNDDITTFSRWVQNYIINNIHTAAKDGIISEQRRLTIMLNALKNYMDYVKKYPDLAKNALDIDKKIRAVANSNRSINLAGVQNISNASYDLSVTKKYGFDPYSNVQQVMANGIDVSNRDALLKSFVYIGQELAKLYMAATMFINVDSANAAYNQFMNAYDYAMSRVQHTGRDAAHNLITYYFYSALAGEPDISAEDKQMAHNMAMQGKSLENRLIAAVTSPNVRVTANQDPAVLDTAGGGTASDIRIKHIHALGGWLPGVYRR